VTRHGGDSESSSTTVANLARALCWVLVFLAPASYSGEQPQPDGAVSTSTDSSALGTFFREPFQEPLGYSLFSANAKERIFERFGKPTNETSTQYPARTSNELIWSTTLEYNGVTFMVGESADRTETWLQSIDVRSSEHILAYGLRIGSSCKDIELAFPGSRFIEYDGGIRSGKEIYETRGGVTAGTAMELRVDFGNDGQVTRFMIESIEL